MGVEIVKLKKFNVFSVAKFQAVLMAVIGLILGIVYTLVGATFGALFDVIGSVQVLVF